jgi:hypothetical protein
MGRSELTFFRPAERQASAAAAQDRTGRRRLQADVGPSISARLSQFQECRLAMGLEGSEIACPVAQQLRNVVRRAVAHPKPHHFRRRAA